MTHEERAMEIAAALMVRYPSMGPSGVGLDPMDVVRAALPALAAVEREALERAAVHCDIMSQGILANEIRALIGGGGE